MFRKIVSFLEIVILLITLSGCATILKDKETKMPVDSEPQGADVFLGKGRNQIRVGRTPAVVTLDNKDIAFLTFRKDGYEETIYVAKPHINHKWMVASFLCLIGPAFIDFVTHNTYSFKESEIKVAIDPILSKKNNQANDKQ